MYTLTYSANFIALPTGIICPARVGQLGATIDLSTIRNAPYAPRLQKILLPSSAHQSDLRPDLGIFPLDILSTLPLPHQVELWEIELRTPIHLHTPVGHIGTLIGAFPGQTIEALDVFLFLQDLAKKSIDYLHDFSGLPHQMQTMVNRTFRTRRTQALSYDVATTWQLFLSGQHVPQGRGPLGIDLLLGNREVWGFEDCSYSGYSIVHLAGGQIDA